MNGSLYIYYVYNIVMTLKGLIMDTFISIMADLTDDDDDDDVM